MLEVYHFVNPLSGDCLETEKKLATYVEQSNKKVAMQIIPVVTMQSARQTAMASSNSLHPSLHDLNVVSQTLYQVAVDTKAAQFQGKKAAREYLMATQQALLQGHAYSDELVIQTVNDLALDQEMFVEDRNSDLAVQAFRADQNLAAEMGVRNFPALVVYDTDRSEYAVRTDDFSDEHLTRLFLSATRQRLREYDGFLHNGGVTEVEEG